MVLPVLSARWVHNYLKVGNKIIAWERPSRIGRGKIIFIYCGAFLLGYLPSVRKVMTQIN